jgi:glycosyltransferase involved in cell wall biosynthesis
MPDVVKRCAPQNIRFFIQAKFGEDSRIDPGPLLALRGLPGVEVHEGPLEQKLYYDVIAKSVVLLPCQAEIYRTKLSGVYLEAKCLGAPVIVPAGSAMAEDVKSSGNGLVFEEYSAAAIAECIARAQRELAELRARAAACAREARPLHGADRCVAAIEKLFGAGA